MAIYTLKHIHRREMMRRIGDGLEYMARVNVSSLMTNDMMTAIGAWMSKETPVFPKL